MMIPHPKFCVLPWVSLEASPIGTVRPCCLAEEELVDDSGTKFNLAAAEFVAIQNSNSMQTLRNQFLAGEQPQTCRKCWREERAGRTSKRMHTLDRLRHMLPEQDWTLDAKPLMFLDLKLGNICNLKCRICGSWSSSTFATEELQFIDAREDRKKNHHYTMLRQGAWPRNNPKFWSEIDHVVDHIEYIEFTGGEPFMIQEHFDMLQGLVLKGHAKQIEIHYNTNGTQWPEQAEEIWRHFRLVEIAFSIDDVGARFEYQRSNAVWSEVQNNIKKFQELQLRHTNIRLQVCSTVNVFNVLYLEPLADWIAQQEFDFVYWNIMHDAPVFSVSTLPRRVKRAVTNQLIWANVAAEHKQEFVNIMDFMNNGYELPANDLLKEIKKVDQRRNESFAKTFPEMALLLNYE